MLTELRITALKDSQKTFDLGRFTAISKQQPVVVVDNHRAVMTFDAQGNFSEVMVKPLRVSMAAVVEENAANGAIKDFMAAAAVLQGFEKRGGTL